MDVSMTSNLKFTVVVVVVVVGAIAHGQPNTVQLFAVTLQTCEQKF
jgi:hypothetical protein